MKLIKIVSLSSFFVLSLLVTVPKAHASTIISETISTNTTWTKSNSPYVVDGQVSVNNNVILTIEPGVIVKFNTTSSSLNVNGAINAQGIATDKIFFTSIKDDSVGGDTNEDSVATTPAPRDWTAIYLNNSGLVNNFNNVVIQYAGGGPCDICSGAGIFNGGRINITNSKISNNGIYGISLQGGTAAIDSTEISYQDYGLFSFTLNPINISRSSIHNNRIYGIFNFYNNNIINATNNWWGDGTGPFHSLLNPLGRGDAVSEGVSFIPWLITEPVPNQEAPTITNPTQFKSDGETAIIESAKTTEGVVIFKATLNDADNDKVKLQVELKNNSEQFDGANLLESDLVDASSTVAIKKENLTDGQYKWRARAVDARGAVSDWQEFGVAGNVDFEVKTVPLYTQNISSYPSEAETAKWAIEPYAGGVANYPGGCGLTIAKCGCAMVSSVMVARYYDVAQDVDNNNFDPKNLNTWLANNNGYKTGGNLDWPSVARYAGSKIKYDSGNSKDYVNDFAYLDNFLANNQPVIAKEIKRGGINSTHFIVIDNKLATTYGVKDPAWYNTKTLNETTDLTNKIRGYENGFDGLRIYEKGNGQATASLSISLASPAELLITDNLGRRLGKDPKTWVEYNEIPNGSYTRDSFDDPTEENPPSDHEFKSIYIDSPQDGNYNLQVIGTDSGGYALDINAEDIGDNTNHQLITNTTSIDQINNYQIVYDALQSGNISIQEIPDTIYPEAKIYFNPIAKELKIEGTDNASRPTLTQQGNIYTISDKSGNYTQLVFNKTVQRDKSLSGNLTSLQYGIQPPIIAPSNTLKFRWSLDNMTQELKFLYQEAEVTGSFKITAQYNQQKNQTEVTIVNNKQRNRQTITGLAIIKLVTKDGVLGYEIK